MQDETLGNSSWICDKGHETAVTLFRVRHGFAGGSSWDFCNVCDGLPAPEQITGMIADILDQARQSGKISQAEWEIQSQKNRNRRPRNVHDRIAQAIEDRMVHGRPVRPANIGGEWMTPQSGTPDETS